MEEGCIISARLLAYLLILFIANGLHNVLKNVHYTGSERVKPEQPAA